jgi:hypothetical protein
MRTFYHLYKFYRRGGSPVIPAIKRASRVWHSGF